MARQTTKANDKATDKAVAVLAARLLVFARAEIAAKQVEVAAASKREQSTERFACEVFRLTKDEALARKATRKAYVDAGYDDKRAGEDASRIMAFFKAKGDAKRSLEMVKPEFKALGIHDKLKVARGSAIIRKGKLVTVEGKKNRQGGSNKLSPVETLDAKLSLAITDAQTAKLTAEQVANVIANVIASSNYKGKITVKS